MRMPSTVLLGVGTISLASALWACMTASAAQFEVIEFVETPEVPADPGTVEWPVTVSLPKFDLSLGTLTGIHFTFTSTATADVGLENLQDGASNTLGYSLPLSGQFLVPTELTATEQTFTLSGSSGVLGSYDGVTDYGGASGITFSLTPAGAVSHLDIDAADFGAYTRSGAPGTYDVTVYLGRPPTQVTGDGAKIFSYVETVASQATVEVTYIYFDGEEVPEAGGWAAAAGLGAVLLGRRLREQRRKRSATRP